MSPQSFTHEEISKATIYLYCNGKYIPIFKVQLRNHIYLKISEWTNNLLHTIVQVSKVHCQFFEHQCRWA